MASISREEYDLLVGLEFLLTTLGILTTSRQDDFTGLDDMKLSHFATRQLKESLVNARKCKNSRSSPFVSVRYQTEFL